MNLFAYAAPQRFYALAGRLIPWFAVSAALLCLVGLWLGFWEAPTDFQQGEVYRIIFIHVPAAWMAMFIYLVMAIYAILNLGFRTRMSAMMIAALAPTGALWAAIALWTGSLWGKPTWGTFWTWDARLTSELILLFLYLAYMLLQASIEERDQADRLSAILAIVGVINIPVIHYSVLWWNSLHQGATLFRAGGPSIDGTMLWPLIVMLLAFYALFAVYMLRTIGNLILEHRIQRQLEG